MTELDFYILKANCRLDRHQFACRLADQIYEQGRRVYLHAGGEGEMRSLDRLLWTFREGSFVPHGVVGETDPQLTPVLLGSRQTPPEPTDVLINLAPTVPVFFDRFQRIAEIVASDPQQLQAGRERFRFYRERNYTCRTHDYPSAATS